LATPHAKPLRLPRRSRIGRLSYPSPLRQRISQGPRLPSPASPGSPPTASCAAPSDGSTQTPPSPEPVILAGPKRARCRWRHRRR